MTWPDFIRTAIGTWPTATWDSDTLTAYVGELTARGIEPAEAIRAVRASEARFPLSAGEVMAAVTVERRRLARDARIEARLRAEVETLRAVPSLGSGE